jgi:hypothetical protein
LLSESRPVNAAVVKGFEHETDVATLREALRLLALENERLTRLNRAAAADSRRTQSSALRRFI